MSWPRWSRARRSTIRRILSRDWQAYQLISWCGGCYRNGSRRPAHRPPRPTGTRPRAARVSWLTRAARSAGS